jgi:hypothetical protein
MASILAVVCDEDIGYGENLKDGIHSSGLMLFPISAIG